MYHDERLPLHPGETPQIRRARVHTPGCCPLTPAIRSDAETGDLIVDEMHAATQSERHERLVDYVASASMEQKNVKATFDESDA
jgi:sulfate adenylyltransferase subunit 2